MNKKEIMSNSIFYTKKLKKHLLNFYYLGLSKVHYEKITLKSQYQLSNTFQNLLSTLLKSI